MATSRRSPSARPAVGTETTRRPGAGRSTLPAPRAARGSGTGRARTSVDPAKPATSDPGPPPPPPRRRGGARPSVTGRAAVLALVFAVLLVSYAYQLRAWFDQHRERSGLQSEAADLEASVERLEQEVRLWEDPAYVAAAARERLNFVLPGEQSYIVVPDAAAEDDEAVGADGLPPAGNGAWYERLWASVTFADAAPPDSSEDGE